jgi:phosphohistidine phosphatase
LRHAKSSWKENIADRERPLNKRGREAARLVGRHLPGAVGPLDLVLCSNARRTRQTLDLILAELPAQPRCHIEDGLYLADCATLFERLRRLDEAAANVLLASANHRPHRLWRPASLRPAPAPASR